MKMIRHIQIAALVLCGSASPLLASFNPTGTYEFQYIPSDGSFSSTYIWVTASLGQPVAASSSIFNYQITTPGAVWTPAGSQSNVGTPTEKPAWASGLVEVTDGGKTLTFLSAANLLSASSGLLSYRGYDVQLTTTSVSGSGYGSQEEPNGSSGTWAPVPADDSPTVPETSNACLLLLTAMAGLGVFHRIQRRRSEAARL